MPLLIYDRFLRKDGQLEYPVSAIPGKPWVPEVFGNVVMVNGKVMPYLEVEPRKYRFRIVNGSNGRFYRLSFGDGHEFHMIGSDQGLLESPAQVERVQLSPAERADVIVDFSKYARAAGSAEQRFAADHAVSRSVARCRRIRVCCRRSCARWSESRRRTP